MSSKILLKKLCFFIFFFSFSAFCNSFNPYEVLGVSPSASETEIKHAYGKLAKQWHPDVNRNLNEEERLRVEEKFKEINRAYEMLKDPRERDKFRNFGVRGAEFSSSQDFSDQRRTFKDIFNESQERRAGDRLELKPYEIRAIEIFHEFSFFQKSTAEFLAAEAGYLSLLKEQQSGQTLSQEQKRRLNDYRVENLKDLEVFKRVLSQLGLPYSSLHPILLQTYLDDLKREWHSRLKSAFPPAEDLRESWSRTDLVQRGRPALPPPAESLIIKEELIRVLREIKTTFDNIQYESLREGSQIHRKPFLKSFGAQFIVFHTALGFSIYMQALYDKKITGYEKNPGELMESARHSLSPSGLVSFFIFVAVASQVQYRLYGLGRSLDGKTVLGKSWNGGLARSLGPPLGLGSGFFFYSLFDGLWRDPNLIPCVKSQFKSDSKESSKSVFQDHITDCEQFYLNWQAGEKWKIYGVDIVSIIGSSLISHKITSSIAKHLSRTMIGYSAMSWAIKKLGPKVIRGANFFINMLMFLEVHKYLDRWAGKPVKEQILAGGVSGNVSDLEGALQNIDFIHPEFWMQDPNEPARAENRLSRASLTLNPIEASHSYLASHSYFKSANDLIKSLGSRFRIWMEFVNQDYAFSYSSWAQKLNKSFINYESSLHVLELFFALSQLDYGTEPTADFLAAYDDEGLRESIRRGSHSYWFYFDVLEEDLKEDKAHYQENYCHLTHKGNMPFWSAFCDNDEIIKFPEAALYDTGRLIFHFLERIEFPDYGLQAEDYISLKKEEMFSSKPEFSIQNLINEHGTRDHDRIVSLAKQMIRKGLEIETVLDNLSGNELSRLKEQKGREYFSNDQEYNYFMSPGLYLNEIKSYCEFLGEFLGEFLDLNTEDLEHCLQFFETSGKKEIQYDLSLKFLKAGIYLLRDFLKRSDSIPLMPPLPHNQSIVSTFLQTEQIKDLISWIEVYKKGERFFAKSREKRRQTQSFFSRVGDQIPVLNQFSGRDGDPYFVFYDLLCNDPDKISPRPDSFSVPQLLKDFEGIELYNFKSKQYEPLCGSKAPYDSEEAHEFLFLRPAKYQGDFYENLYLSAEDIISAGFINRDSVMGGYYNLPQVQDQLEVLRQASFLEIQALMDQFYKKAINQNAPVDYNPDPEFLGINQSLLDYYDDNKVYFNSCTLIEDLSFNLSREVLGNCEEGFRNIEVSIFQIHYLLKNLKTLLMKGEELEVCDETAECKSLNQSFLWTNDGDPQSFDEEGFDRIHSKSITYFQNIHNCYKDKKDCRPDVTSQEVIRSFIFGLAAPKWGQENGADYNLERRDHSYWEKLIFSLLFEINNSLNNFTNQTMPLTLKSHFEQRLQDPKLNFGQ